MQRTELSTELRETLGEARWAEYQSHIAEASGIFVISAREGLPFPADRLGPAFDTPKYRNAYCRLVSQVSGK